VPNPPPASSVRFTEMWPPINDPLTSEPSTTAKFEQGSTHRGVRWSKRLSPRTTSEVMVARQSTIIKRSTCNRHLVRQVNCGDTKDFAFKISLNSALRERGNEARPVIMAELRQMVDKCV